jgi:tetratricopeptide (TPR) repeat protein
MDDNDRYFQIFLFAIFWCVTSLLAANWGSTFLVKIFIFLLPFLLSLIWPKLVNLISFAGTSLIYGFSSPDLSYENRYYAEHMGKAKRLVREEKWNEAIVAYREVIQKAPKMCEPRFNLARIYQKAGHLSLAFIEYKRILKLKDELGSNHAFVVESERAIQEIKELLKGDLKRISEE